MDSSPWLHEEPWPINMDDHHIFQDDESESTIHPKKSEIMEGPTRASNNKGTTLEPDILEEDVEEKKSDDERNTSTFESPRASPLTTVPPEIFEEEEEEEENEEEGKKSTMEDEDLSSLGTNSVGPKRLSSSQDPPASYRLTTMEEKKSETNISTMESPRASPLNTVTPETSEEEDDIEEEKNSKDDDLSSVGTNSVGRNRLSSSLLDPPHPYRLETIDSTECPASDTSSVQTGTLFESIDSLLDLPPGAAAKSSGVNELYDDSIIPSTSTSWLGVDTKLLDPESNVALSESFPSRDPEATTYFDGANDKGSSSDSSSYQSPESDDDNIQCVITSEEEGFSDDHHITQKRERVHTHQQESKGDNGLFLSLATKWSLMVAVCLLFVSLILLVVYIIANLDNNNDTVSNSNTDESDDDNDDFWNSFANR